MQTVSNSAILTREVNCLVLYFARPKSTACSVNTEIAILCGLVHPRSRDILFYLLMYASFYGSRTLLVFFLFFFPRGFFPRLWPATQQLLPIWRLHGTWWRNWRLSYEWMLHVVLGSELIFIDNRGHQESTTSQLLEILMWKQTLMETQYLCYKTRR